MPVIELTNVIDGVKPWSGSGVSTVSDAEVKIADFTLTSAEVAAIATTPKMLVEGEADTTYIPLHLMLQVYTLGSEGIVGEGSANDVLQIYRNDGTNSAAIGDSIVRSVWNGGSNGFDRSDLVFEDSDEGEDAFWENASLELRTNASGWVAQGSADNHLRVVLVYLEADTS